MSASRKAMLELFQLALLFIIISGISVYAPDAFLLRKPTTLLLLVLATALLIRFSERIIDLRVRRFLILVAVMIIAWIILRGAKYIAFEETEVVARHIWYLYYVPALSIPQLSMFAALEVEGREKRVKLKIERVTSVITLLLMLCVVTNDLHQWVFRFNPGFAGWDYDYSRGLLFIAVYAWIVLLFFFVLFILYRRCRLSESRRLIWAPIIPAAFGIVYLVLYALDLWPRVGGELFGQFPEAVAFTMAGFWLSLIRIGLIPSNEGYASLFEASELSAQIADTGLNVVYRSKGAATLDKSRLASENTVMLGDNTRLHRKAVHGGYVYWQDDITELNRLNAELSEVGERLSEEVELLRMENELEEERARIEARTRVYDRIADEVKPQLERIADLSAQAEGDPDAYEKNMGLVCLLGAFIKRYSNLALLAADSCEVPAEELRLAVAESLRQLETLGIPAVVICSRSRQIPAGRVTEAYSLFECLLEQSLPALKGVTAAIDERELKLTMEGAEAVLPENENAAAYFEDGASYIRIPLSGEGEKI